MSGNLVVSSPEQRVANRALAEKYAVGDPSAVRCIDEWIDAVLRRHFRSLQDDWDDLRQEVRVRILDNIRRSRFEGRSSFRTYVHGVARNTGIDALRAGSRRRANEESSRSMTRAIAGGESGADARILAAAILSRLDAAQRDLLRLIFLDGRSYVEIAERLGIAEGTVKSRVARCKAKLLSGRIDP